jgi:hypothetical protein
MSYDAIVQLRGKFVGFTGPDRPPASAASGDEDNDGDEDESGAQL